jgi:ribonuclease J
MSTSYTPHEFGSGLSFLPLGGAGEIGMNLNLYQCDGKWLMIDLGITFGDERLPSVDVILPDAGFIIDRSDDLLALVITHAHEDHLGAIPYLWSKLRCPIYATPFAASFLRAKLHGEGIGEAAQIHVISDNKQLDIGPFQIEFVNLTHSIPEANGLALRTPYGTVFHTADWKFDPDPVVGEVSDEKALRRIGEEGVLAMVCDSTNVFRAGVSGSEGTLRPSLIDLVDSYDKRVVVACFASNIARLKTLAIVAEATGRRTCLVGRSLWRMNEVAGGCGYFDDIPPFLSPREARKLAHNKILYICTGSQGEPRAALSRIAMGKHPDLKLNSGDAVIFSSRIIPGNEKKIAWLMGRLMKLGVKLITEDDHFVHVSGHPFRGELQRMYEYIQPQIAIPVHGETHHLIEHARLAREWGAEQALVVEDGEMVNLAPGRAAIVCDVGSGRFAVDGARLLELEGREFSNRQRAVFQGAVALTLVIDGKGNLAVDPKLAAPGLIEPGDEVRGLVEKQVREAFDRLGKLERRDNDRVADATGRELRRALSKAIGKKPIAEVQIIRL